MGDDDPLLAPGPCSTANNDESGRTGARMASLSLSLWNEYNNMLPAVMGWQLLGELNSWISQSRS